MNDLVITQPIPHQCRPGSVTYGSLQLSCLPHRHHRRRRRRRRRQNCATVRTTSIAGALDSSPRLGPAASPKRLCRGGSSYPPLGALVMPDSLNAIAAEANQRVACLVDHSCRYRFELATVSFRRRRFLLAFYQLPSLAPRAASGRPAFARYSNL